MYNSKKHTDLEYMKNLTRGNAGMIVEMINAYLEENPQLVNAMKIAVEKKDWVALRAAAHSILPSFSMVGMDKEFELDTKTILTQAAQLQSNRISTKEQVSTINKLVAKIEKACTQACSELQSEKLKLK